MLPDDLPIPAKNGKLYTHWLRFGRYRGVGNRFWCAYPGGTARTTLEERAATEADARAKLLIYLLEHHLHPSLEAVPQAGQSGSEDVQKVQGH
jgi:hypothetical protein